MQTLRKNPGGDAPNVHRSAYIDPAAVVIGRVTIGRNVFVGPGAVIRADEHDSAVVIGDRCNIQDRVIVHALAGTQVVVGAGSSLSHGCIVHGPCSIGKACFIGFGSVVFQSALADKAVVKHLAVVENVSIPKGRAVRSRMTVDSEEQVRTLGAVCADWREFTRKVIRTNTELARGYRLQDSITDH